MRHLWIIIFDAVLIAALATGCAPQSKLYQVQPKTGALRNAGVSVKQAQDRLAAEPKPDENVQAAILLLHPVPEELAEHQKAYDELWDTAQKDANSVEEDNATIHKMNHQFFSPLQERLFAYFLAAYLLGGIAYGIWTSFLGGGLGLASIPMILFHAVAWLPTILLKGILAKPIPKS